jgi:hypothetical protein
LNRTRYQSGTRRDLESVQFLGAIHAQHCRSRHTFKSIDACQLDFDSAFVHTPKGSFRSKLNGRQIAMPAQKKKDLPVGIKAYRTPN